MKNFFNINLEFDIKEFEALINRNIKERNKGYVCFIDGNIVSECKTDYNYRNIVNSSIINACDGSSIALFASIKYKNKIYPITGPNFFRKYIMLDYKQVIIGSTNEAVDQLLLKVKECKNNYKIYYLPLPFDSVNSFDYKQIAYDINKIEPDIIWVSLGAPKQELFMSKLQPFINKGIMLGIGAAIDIYIGKTKLPNFNLDIISLNWAFRIFQEPKKQLKRFVRYLFYIPILMFDEFIRKK